MPGIPDRQALLVIVRRVQALVNGALLVLFCGLLAQWTWTFAGPESKPLMEAPDSSRQSAQLDGQMAGIFFAAEDGAAEQPAAPPLNLTLVGAFSGKKGFAIVRVNDQTQVVTVGDEIAPGAVLADIKPRAIEVQRNGETQEVALATSAGAGAAAAAPGNTGDTATDADGNAQGGGAATADAGPPAAAAQVGLATVRIGRTRVFFTSRELSAAVQKLSPQALFGPVQQVAGGWQLSHVQPGTPGYWLGLRSRDVLTEIDGAPIQDANQIYALQQQLQQAGKFKLSGRRAGRPLTLVYTTEE